MSVCLSVFLSATLIFSNAYQFVPMVDILVRSRLYPYDVFDSNRPYTLKHSIPPSNFSHIIYPPHRTIVPYHQHTVSHTVIIPYRISTKQTISSFDMTYRATPHTVLHHIPYHTHTTVPTPPEGLNHTSTQEEHAPRREHSSANEYRYYTAVPTPRVWT